jgi:hypothetical protein
VTSPIRPGELPAHALLARYRADGAFTDCWIADLSRPVTHADYVDAFYTTALFGVERRLLAWFASKPSTAAQARLLAESRAEAFAAWTVEARAADQLLLCDFTRRTRSWLMVEPFADGAGTRLYFGSAVVPRRDATGVGGSMGMVFHALSGFHAVYSRALLGAARARLMKVGAGAAEPAMPAVPAPTVSPATPASPAMSAARATPATRATTATTAAPATRATTATTATTAAPAAPATRAAPATSSPAPDPMSAPAPNRHRRTGPAFRERPTREQIAELPPFDPLPLERIVVVETAEQAEAALRAMTHARFVGFDTESKPTFTRDAVRDGPHVIQFATTEQGFIVQVNDRTPIAFLREVLESEAIVKVGFGLDSDRGPLEHKLRTRLHASVEVSQVLRSLGHKQALGAKAAVAVVLGRRMTKSKSVTTSNWGAARLSPQQLLYAANDAYAALKVFEAMGSPYP